MPQATDIGSVPWADAIERMAWRQGEHTTLIGPTGVGKTELAIALTDHLPWVVFLSTKRMDSTTDTLRNRGFHTIRTPRELNPEIHNRYVVSPKWSAKLDAGAQDARHTEIFSDTLSRAFWQTGWTVVIDELEYINRDLKIMAPVNRLLRQGRSQGNSMILGTQRPRHVTLHAYEQATHLFVWRQSDASNVERAAELTGLPKREISGIVAGLDHHDTLYVNTITGDMFVTNTRW